MFEKKRETITKLFFKSYFNYSLKRSSAHLLAKGLFIDVKRIMSHSFTFFLILNYQSGLLELALLLFTKYGK